MIGAVAVIFAPMIVALTLMSTWAGIVAVFGVLCAAAVATEIQLCFRVQAKRSQFRRRQTSSRLATFAEAFSSIAWAGAAGMAAEGTWLAFIPVGIAFGILLAVRLMAPARHATK